MGGGQAEQTTQRKEQEALCQQAPDECSAVGAHRLAKGKLPTAAPFLAG